MSFNCSSKAIIMSLCLLGGTFFMSYGQDKRFKITEDKANKRVDIRVDDKLFTSYIYPDSLMKPVLYPILSSGGDFITRGWPLDSRAGERVDHPHHIGLWFNYGDVNGLDFWNNSSHIPVERKHKYGSIKHVSVNSSSVGEDGAELEVSAYWVNSDGANLLKEDKKFIFSASGDKRAIEMIVTLTALDQDISFLDNKEGLLGIRITRELEHPSDHPEKFTDATGNVTEVARLNNDDVTGVYYSSNGKVGDEVWGTRGKWVYLTGTIKNTPVSVLILDHPENVGYPAYWHARGYGLFAANPLGQKEFSRGKEELGFKLNAGESVTFRYKVLINSGNKLSDKQANSEFDDFKNNKN